MKLTLESYGKLVSIETESDDLTIDEVFEELVEPAVLAAGFQRKSIDNYYENSQRD